jgi:hypothetical protein
MLDIFHVNVITYQIFNLLHIYCIFAKKTFIKRKFIKLIIRYPNTIQIMWKDMG